MIEGICLMHIGASLSMLKVYRKWATVCSNQVPHQQQTVILTNQRAGIPFTADKNKMDSCMEPSQFRYEWPISTAI
jgi:hypothetical protein